ncbi:hypothetical protein PRZ48_006817 [Zasmidium cellare]|uniref:Uncharacterized protein n=1 Tax=Zasmidium cellare TaxID=395010 RepID=A0ABR0EID9_ZASCE|nr:hypothetical protein PRZ48_006817 [Zasmidium cellare]
MNYPTDSTLGPLEYGKTRDLQSPCPRTVDKKLDTEDLLFIDTACLRLAREQKKAEKPQFHYDPYNEILSAEGSASMDRFFEWIVQNTTAKVIISFGRIPMEKTMAAMRPTHYFTLEDSVPLYGKCIHVAACMNKDGSSERFHFMVYPPERMMYGLSYQLSALCGYLIHTVCAYAGHAVRNPNFFMNFTRKKYYVRRNETVLSPLVEQTASTDASEIPKLPWAVQAKRIQEAEIRTFNHAFTHASQWWLVNKRNDYGLPPMPDYTVRYIFDWHLGVDELLEVSALRILLYANRSFKSMTQRRRVQVLWKHGIHTTVSDLFKSNQSLWHPKVELRDEARETLDKWDFEMR